MEEIDLLDIIKIIKKKIWLILAVTVSAALIGGIYSIFVIHPVYQAKATLIVGRTPAGATEQMQYNDVLTYEKLVKTYAELAKSDLVAGETISKAGYDLTEGQLEKNLTVTLRTGTQVLEVSVQSDDPEKAYNLTNTLSEVFVEEIKNIMNDSNVKIMDKAKLPESPIKPNKMLNIAIAALLGLMASVGIVFLMEYLDNTIKTENDVEKYLGITILATIPYVKEEAN